MMYICRMNLAIEDIALLVRVTFFHLSFVKG